jgi:hypothetical protein
MWFHPRPMKTYCRFRFATLAAAIAISGCAYYKPLNLVATNIRTTDRDLLTSGSKRVEADVCGNRLLGIPFGPDPRISTMMEALQAQVTNAVGFEDVRIDQSVVIYFLPIFWQDCVHGSAFPLFPVTKARAPKQKAPAAPAPETQPPQPEPTEGAAAPAKSQDPFAE